MPKSIAEILEEARRIAAERGEIGFTPEFVLKLLDALDLCMKQKAEWAVEVVHLPIDAINTALRQEAAAIQAKLEGGE